MRDAADTPPVVTEVPVQNEWTRPMHPEIRRWAPGNPPICSMALDPRVLTRNGPESHELRNMTRSFWVSAALAGPAFVIGMLDLLPGQPISSALPFRAFSFRELALVTRYSSEPRCRSTPVPLRVLLECGPRAGAQ